MKKRYLKVILTAVVLTFSIFFMTGCESKITPQEQIEKSLKRMGEIDTYLAQVIIEYSDEEKNVGATLIGEVDTKSDVVPVEGRMNYNGETFQTIGYKNASRLILQDVNRNYVSLNYSIPHLKDLKITKVREIIDRSGDKDLKYYIGTIEDKYEAKIGIGEDDVIYTMEFNLKNTRKEKLVSVYKLTLNISDEYEYKPVPSAVNITNRDDFFDLFIGTDEVVKEG